MIKIIELFAGIGSQHSALKRLGIDFEVVGIAEIDKYAIKSYEAIHGKVHNYGDISKIERLDPADFWTYSFPCQDLSIAGNQKGLGEGTMSGLLYEVERLLNAAKSNDELPKYLMLENVKNLVGKKFKSDFDKWIEKLDQLGYNTYWKVLNAKNYGVPQNRERVFAISIRKDVDNGYQFPEPFKNGIRLKDILEGEVDEKFYISGEKVEKILSSTFRQERDRIQTKDHCDTLLSRDYKSPKLVSSEETPVRIGNIYGEDRGTGFAGNVWDKEHLSPTLTTMQGGNRQPMIIDDIYKSREPRRYMESSPTLRSGKASELKVLLPQYRVRKLTPKECFRLMGFTDEEFHKAEKVNSNSQLYKQAGNSIVVDVLYYLFKNLFTEVE